TEPRPAHGNAATHALARAKPRMRREPELLGAAMLPIQDLRSIERDGRTIAPGLEMGHGTAERACGKGDSVAASEIMIETFDIRHGTLRLSQRTGRPWSKRS